jgi:hypothetical protein
MIVYPRLGQTKLNSGEQEVCVARQAITEQPDTTRADLAEPVGATQGKPPS